MSLKGLDEEARQNQTSYNKQYAHLLASRRSRISNLLGRGGVKWVENALALDNKCLADATEEEVNDVIEFFDSQRSQTLQLNSRRNRIGSLLGAG